MSTQYEQEKREETEQLATYRLLIIKWLLSNDEKVLEQAAAIARAHDKACMCKECGLVGFAARHETFAMNLRHKHVKSWHRLISWFGSDGMTGFYREVHMVFGTLLQEEFPHFYNWEYVKIKEKSPFGTNHKRAFLSTVGSTITLECYDMDSLLAFLKKLGLSDSQIDALTSIEMSDSAVHDIIVGDHGWSADAATGRELCLI